MVCIHCLKDIVDYGPLGYCAQCSVWYKAEGKEIEGIYMLCSTKDDEPEKCNEFVQSLIMRVEEVPESGEITIVPTTLKNIYKADKICAFCETKHFSRR